MARVPSFMTNSKQGEKISEQDILKAFDVTDDPFLTATEIADQLPVSRQAVNYRLEKMFEKGKVDKKKTGARSVGWWSTVAPRLSDEAKEQADSADREKAVSLDEIEERFN